MKAHVQCKPFILSPKMINWTDFFHCCRSGKHWPAISRRFHSTHQDPNKIKLDGNPLQHPEWFEIYFGGAFSSKISI